jgi:endo-1,4-beta-D-glucanase Y
MTVTNKSLETGMWFSVEIDHKDAYKFNKDVVYKWTYENMVMARVFEVMFDRLNVDKICTWVAGFFRK